MAEPAQIPIVAWKNDAVEFLTCETTIATAAEPKFSVHELNRDDKVSRETFPLFVDRALRFIERYDSDTDQEWLSNLLWTAFRIRNETVKMLVGLDEKGEIIAHLIAYVENRGRLGNVIFVLQAEKDVSPLYLSEEALQILKAWAKKLKVETIVALCVNRKVAKAFERYGFTEYRVYVRLIL